MLLYVILMAAYATSYTLDETAIRLQGRNSIETASRIADYIMAEYSYEYSQFPQPIENTFLSRTGDCTDYSMLAVYMLTKVRLELEFWRGGKRMKVLKVTQQGLGCDRVMYVKNKQKQKFWENFCNKMQGGAIGIKTKIKWVEM